MSDGSISLFIPMLCCDNISRVPNLILSDGLLVMSAIGQLVPSVMILTRYLCIIQNNAIDAIRLSLYMSRLFIFMSDGPISSVWSISHYLIL